MQYDNITLAYKLNHVLMCYKNSIFICKILNNQSRYILVLRILYQNLEIGYKNFWTLDLS